MKGHKVCSRFVPIRAVPWCKVTFFVGTVATALGFCLNLVVGAQI